MDDTTGRQVTAAEVANDRLVEILARNGDIVDQEFKSKDIYEVLGAVLSALGELERRWVP